MNTKEIFSNFFISLIATTIASIFLSVIFPNGIQFFPTEEGAFLIYNIKKSQFQDISIIQITFTNKSKYGFQNLAFDPKHMGEIKLKAINKEGLSLSGGIQTAMWSVDLGIEEELEILLIGINLNIENSDNMFKGFYTRKDIRGMPIKEKIITISSAEYLNKIYKRMEFVPKLLGNAKSKHIPPSIWRALGVC